MWTETDGGNSDICNLADFSSEEEDTSVDTVVDNLRASQQLLRRGVLSVHRTMEGAALVDDRLGVTFDVELCVPWDTPETVVDINLADVVTLGSVPDKVGLFGRRKNAAASQGRLDI